MRARGSWARRTRACSESISRLHRFMPHVEVVRGRLAAELCDLVPDGDHDRVGDLAEELARRLGLGCLSVAVEVDRRSDDRLDDRTEPTLIYLVRSPLPDRDDGDLWRQQSEPGHARLRLHRPLRRILRDS